MAGPWEQYQNAGPAAVAAPGPWTQYVAPAEQRDADGSLVLSMSHQDPAQAPEQPEATTAQRIQASVPGRVLQGMRDPVDAVTQMGMRAIPSGVINGVNAATQYVNELPVIGPITKALGMVPATQDGLDQQIRDNEAQYQASRKAAGSEGMDLARLGGNVLATLPAAGASVPAAGANMLARIGTGMASGAAFGGLQPVTEGNFGEEKLKQMAIGGGFGAGGAILGGGLARLISPNASTNPQVQTLLNAGVTPTPGQMLGGIAQRTEDKLTSVPGLGDAIVHARRRGVNEFNSAALNRALVPIGQQTNLIGREGAEHVRDALRDAYDNLLPQLHWRADNQFAQDLGRLQQMAATLPQEQANRFQRIVQDQIVGKMTPQGVLDGEAFKGVESELGRLARGLRGDASFDNRDLGAAIGELQTSLRDTLARVNPNHAQELGAINRGFAEFVRIRDATSRIGAENGVFTPAQYSSAIRAADSSRSKGQFATGNALSQDLGDAGKTIMSSRIPDSGTAGRAMLGLAAGGAAGMLAPNALLGIGAASIPYLAGPNRLAAMALGMRPQAAQGIADQIRRVGPAVGVLAGPAAYQSGSN